MFASVVVHAIKISVQGTGPRLDQEMGMCRRDNKFHVVATRTSVKVHKNLAIRMGNQRLTLMIRPFHLDSFMFLEY